ncbi:hypothetical protein EVAR_88701_1 [Eumeta japonica]|uniref:Uncharacterized protein n=1 Tax=Eumeta variegata TaxID=151549 RepID=A0A4C1Y3R5_EUMVA|nr:hypothetical protein EVAR_88701_1 [Eumeta japonica]
MAMKEKYKPIIENSSDAGRLLCDLHHSKTVTRHSLLTNSLNKTSKNGLRSLSRDKYLFGQNLSGKLSDLKLISKSASDMKKQTFKSNTPIKTISRQRIAHTDNLNSKRPPRLAAPTAIRPRLGKHQPTIRKGSNYNNQPLEHRRYNLR